MKRRTLLSSTGLALATPLAGCLADGNGNASEADRECDPPEYPDYDGDYPRVDEPPHDVVVPDEIDDGDEDVLGECMETASDLEYTVSPPYAAGPELRLTSRDGQAYRVALITTESERDEQFDIEDLDDDARDRLMGVDFDETVLLVVESGWTGASDHRWARVDTVDGGIHLHGYYALSTSRTLESRLQTSVLEVETSGDIEFARVSLTERGADGVRRVNFDSTEGVVRLASGDEPETYTIEAVHIDEDLPPSDEPCEFAALTDAAQSEVETAIADGEYTTDDRPAWLESNCYSRFIRYEGENYSIEVTAS